MPIYISPLNARTIFQENWNSESTLEGALRHPIKGSSSDRSLTSLIHHEDFRGSPPAVAVRPRLLRAARPRGQGGKTSSRRRREPPGGRPSPSELAVVRVGGEPLAVQLRLFRGLWRLLRSLGSCRHSAAEDLLGEGADASRCCASPGSSLPANLGNNWLKKSQSSIVS
ncbi:uncharacterized protein [Penaeus vannamei]|uniref:uncharacterized protein n=1 Tax=Penaeus vannamei TaxID=6689 RepID=UPI00387FAF80